MWACTRRLLTIVGDEEPAAVLAYYLEIGQTLGHSPNRMFDEPWHRQTYPQIAELVVAGHWRSTFDAYCRRGALDRSAHWLFDELAYRDRYPDLTNEVLAEFGIFNGYDHYLRHGIKEDRIGHLLFDPNVYLSHFDAADVAAIRANGVFQHYLNRIELGRTRTADIDLFRSSMVSESLSRRRSGHRSEALEMRAASLPVQRYARLLSIRWRAFRSPGTSSATPACGRSSRRAASATDTCTSCGSARRNCGLRRHRSTLPGMPRSRRSDRIWSKDARPMPIRTG